MTVLQNRRYVRKITIIKRLIVGHFFESVEMVQVAKRFTKLFSLFMLTIHCANINDYDYRFISPFNIYIWTIKRSQTRSYSIINEKIIRILQQIKRLNIYQKEYLFIRLAHCATEFAIYLHMYLS